MAAPAKKQGKTQQHTSGGGSKKRGRKEEDSEKSDSDDDDSSEEEEEEEEEAPAVVVVPQKKAAAAAKKKKGKAESGANSLQLFNKNKPTHKKGAAASDDSSSSNGSGSDSESEGESESDDNEGPTTTQQTDEEMRAFRRRMRIAVHGQEIPPCIGTFDEMETDPLLKQVLLRNIEASKWVEPTPIQMQSIPAMAAGRDMLASAPTGSGKTAAFVIPTLLRLRSPTPKSHTHTHTRKGPRAIFLAPTRELATQIHTEAERLAQGRKFKIGLMSKSLAATGRTGGEKAALGKYDIMVTTPLRLVSVLREGLVDLSEVEVIVLDEADKLFELGKEDKPEKNHTHSNTDTDTDTPTQNPDKSFLTQVDELLAACSHPQVQRALFSATLPPAVEDLATTILRDPLKISIGTTNAGAPNIEQKLVFVGREEGKLLALRQLIREGLRPPVLVFLQSKDRARELYHELVYDGIRVDVMHAERTPEQRATLIRRFRTGEVWVLLCTDLLARGLDFKAVNMVINYDLPQSAVSYIHRIGRTGRAGREGVAVTFFTESDMAHLRAIANVVKLSGGVVPEWMLTLKKEKGKERRKLEVSAPRRGGISTVSGWDRQRRFRKKEAVRRSQQLGGKKGEGGEGGVEKLGS